MKRKKGQSKKRTRLYILLSVLAVLAVYGGIRGFIYYANTLESNISVADNKKAFLLIYENDTFEDVVEKLAKSGVVKNMESFIKVAKKRDYSEHIVSGRYELVDGMSNGTLIQRLINGRQTPVRVTFNNIRTKELLAKRFAAQLRMDSADLMCVLNDREILSEYGLKPTTAVCLFIPNTYEMYWDISPEELLKRMKKEYDTFWTEERMMKLNEVGLNQTEVSTLASIVEEETLRKDEKPKVAGLYLNRIHIGMRLQADPTIKFAIDSFSLRRVIKLHIRMAEDSPYSTYEHAGLPPGPIKIPSIESIDAVLDYQSHNYLYMCAKGDGSGYHDFTINYNEHQTNAARYHRKLNKAGIH